jgi:hypothetical protein
MSAQRRPRARGFVDYRLQRRAVLRSLEHGA